MQSSFPTSRCPAWVAFPEVVGPIYDEINQIYGTNYSPAVTED